MMASIANAWLLQEPDHRRAELKCLDFVVSVAATAGTDFHRAMNPMLMDEAWQLLVSDVLL